VGPYLYVHSLKKDDTYKTLEFSEKSSIINEDLFEEISDEEKNTEKDNTKPNKNIKKSFFELPSFLHTNVKAKEKNPVRKTSFNKFKNVVLKIMKRNLSVEDQKQECKELENLKDKIYKPTSENEEQYNYNCIFTYGQTNSGKPYTMKGGIIEQSEGIIPRTVCIFLYT